MHVPKVTRVCSFTGLCISSMLHCSQYDVFSSPPSLSLGLPVFLFVFSTGYPVQCDGTHGWAADMAGF